MQAISLRLSSVWARYEGMLQRRPVRTQMATSAILWGLGDVIAQKAVEEKKRLDVKRTMATAAFGGAFIGPVGHYWYLLLDQFCMKIAVAGSTKFLASKVALDTFLLGPAYVMAFYAWGSAVIDQTGWDGLKKKVQQDFLPTYMAELAIWPAFQVANFSKIPVRHQLLAVNFMTLIDATFLSWARNQEDWTAPLRAFVKDKTTTAVMKQ